MKRHLLPFMLVLLASPLAAESPAGQTGVKGGFHKVTIAEEELLLGGNILLQVDDIKLTGPESLLKLMVYLNDINSTVTHNIKVLRAGQIVDLRWISKDFQSTVQ